MKASVVDLRYRMREILQALDRNEEVTILYHGKEKAKIRPIRKNSSIRVKDHPFFGSTCRNDDPVLERMKELRGGRYNAI